MLIGTRPRLWSARIYKSSSDSKPVKIKKSHINYLFLVMIWLFFCLQSEYSLLFILYYSDKKVLLGTKTLLLSDLFAQECTVQTQSFRINR